MTVSNGRSISGVLFGKLTLLSLFACAAFCVMAMSVPALARGGLGNDGAVEGEISGTVSEVNKQYFVFEAPNGVEMHIHVDGNTVYYIGPKVATSPHIVVGTRVTVVAGNSVRVGDVEALVLRVTPSKDELSGKVLSINKSEGSFVIQQGEKDKLKVFVIKETKIKKIDNARLIVGANVTVTPITNKPEKVEAWILTISNDGSTR